VQPEQLIVKNVGLHLIVDVEWLVRKVGTWHPDRLTLLTLSNGIELLVPKHLLFVTLNA
jgi:hypothetical protein